MTCFSIKRRSTAYLDGKLRDRERSQVAAHLAECDSCGSYFNQVGSMRSALHHLPAPAAPPTLRTKLRVIASRERKKLLETHGSRLHFLWEKWSFRVNQFMRPLTIPATGGLLSSVILFGSLAFAITQSTRGVTYEVPLFYENRTDANLLPLDVRSAVFLTINLDKGRIRDYAVRDNSESFTGDASSLVTNNIALPQLPTVLTFTRPVSGDISISLTPIVFRQ